MFVDEMEKADVAILDSALSAEDRVQTSDSPLPAADRFGAARGATAGVLVGAALWASILLPLIKH